MLSEMRAKMFGLPGLLVLAIVIGALVVAACGSESTSEAPSAPAQPAAAQPAAQAAPGTGTTPQQPASAMPAASALPPMVGSVPTPTAKIKEQRAGLRGTIEIDGSSTVAPITEAVAEEFRSVAPDVLVNVGISGSGGGFKQFTVGETDISDASRPIKENEAATAAENGVEYYEFLVGLDGLSVMVNPQNDFVDCMTVGQLNMLWKPESTITKWSDLDSSWPDRKINLYGPGTDSGTFDYFTEEVNGEAKLSRADYTASEDDNVLVQGISGDRNALGYFGFAYYAVSADKLKLLDIDNGNGCVAPTIETIASGTYSPLSRPLFIYVNKERAQQRAELRSFVEFYMENGAQLAEEVGYVPLPQASYQQNLAVLSGQQVMMEAGPKVALSGTIEIDGSSTVAPITEAVAEEFRKEQPGVLVNVGISGSGGGFKRFMVGETDVSDASRAIKSSEAATAAENSISYFEFLVGVDGLSVMVNSDNDFVNCLTLEQLNMLWKPESTISKWSDLDSSWPDRDINLYGPGTDSGTFDYFTEEVNGEAKLSRADYTASEDDNVLVQGISGDRNSLGYFGYAYYAANTDKLKLVAVDSGNGCVTPSLDTIASGQYTPLSRPLFIYVSSESLQRPEVKGFVEFYMLHGQQLTGEVGYVPLATHAYQNNLNVVQASVRPEGSLTGTIEIDGSSTVAPITEAVAEEYRKEQPGVLVNVGISGSGGGFKRFTAGEADISDASRVIKDSEASAAKENGIEYYEFLVGVDGLSVMVNPQNDFVNCMTTEQLNMLWKPESTVDSWNDLDPSWPDRQINLYGPGTDSGTFDYFTEEINGESKLSRADYTASEDDNVLVQGISGDRNSLGYFGFAYYAANTDKLKLVAVDSGNGCVTPSLDTIASGSYSPLSRPLFIYVNKSSLERPEVRDFVRFYMLNGQSLTSDVGYVPLSMQSYQNNMALLK